MPVAFIADELKKLWDLKQAGALTEHEFALQKARLIGEHNEQNMIKASSEQPTTEDNPKRPVITASPEQPATQATPERPAIEASPEQNIIEAVPERPATEDNPEQSEPKPEAASVHVPDSQGQEVDTSGPPSEPVSSPAPSHKVESRPLVKCPECGAPTFDLAHHRHLPLYIPDRRYKAPAEDSERIGTEEKENFGKNAADVIKAPQSSPTAIPAPERIVAPPGRVQKAKGGGGWLILKIVFWVVAFLCVLYIIASVVSNRPTPPSP